MIAHWHKSRGAQALRRYIMLTTRSEEKLWGASIASSPPEVSFESVVEAKNLTGLADLTDKIVSLSLPCN